MSTIMDIGTHCAYCRQLDFLPFVCDGCNQEFCASHRTKLEHHCKALLAENLASPTPEPVRVAKTGQIAALFPDRDRDRAKLERLLESPKPASTIKETQFRVGDVAAQTPNAFEKLKALFGATKGGKSSQKTSTLRTAAVLQLRKTAVGDARVKPVDRVHLWCSYVDVSSGKVPGGADSSRRGVWVSKQWPVGRAVDELAVTLRLKNVNNSSSDSLQRLAMYMKGQEPVRVAASERCSRFKEGDTVYLVRG